MRQLALVLASLFALTFSTPDADASRGHGSGGGHYKGGRGSSHKGGSYRRKSTNNHYRRR
jgi:hypothetical protein